MRNSIIIASVIGANAAALLFILSSFLFPSIMFGMFIFLSAGLIASELQTSKA